MDSETNKQAQKRKERKKMKEINFVYPEVLYLVIKKEFIESEDECTVTFDNMKVFLTKKDAKRYIKRIKKGWINVKCVKVSYKELNRIYERKVINVFKEDE